jgi:hypothetical protein
MLKGLVPMRLPEGCLNGAWLVEARLEPQSLADQAAQRRGRARQQGWPNASAAARSCPIGWPCSSPTVSATTITACPTAC